MTLTDQLAQTYVHLPIGIDGPTVRFRSSVDLAKVILEMNRLRDIQMPF